MRKTVINITGTSEIEFENNQVYVCERIYNGRKCRVYDLSTDCKREATSVKRLASVIPELNDLYETYLECGCNETLSMECDEIMVEATESGYYVVAVVFEDEIELKAMENVENNVIKMESKEMANFKRNEVILLNDNGIYTVMQINCKRDGKIYMLVNGAKFTTDLMTEDGIGEYFTYHNVEIYANGVVHHTLKFDTVSKFYRWGYVMTQDEYANAKAKYADSSLSDNAILKTLFNDYEIGVNPELDTHLDYEDVNTIKEGVDNMSEAMEENATVTENTVYVETDSTHKVEELLPIEPEYITRLINQANLVNQELAERTRDILYLEDDNRRNLFKIASQLAKINRANLYKDDGFKSISEYAEKVLGYKGSTTRALCRIADRFLNEMGEITNPELVDFSIYQLMEILKLNDSELQLALTDGSVSSELSTKKIRDNIKKSKVMRDVEKQETEGKNVLSEQSTMADISHEEIPETREEKTENKPTYKKDEDAPRPDSRGEAIVILTSLMAQICKDSNISPETCENYTEQIKRAISCIK